MATLKANLCSEWIFCKKKSDHQQIFDWLNETKYFSTLDLCQGYYQIAFDDNGRMKSAFSIKN